MVSEDCGRNPPFSPIGIRHAAVVPDDAPSGNVGDMERVVFLSNASVPPRNVLHLWQDVANVYDTQKQGTLNDERVSSWCRILGFDFSCLGPTDF